MKDVRMRDVIIKSLSIGLLLFAMAPFLLHSVFLILDYFIALWTVPPRVEGTWTRAESTVSIGWTSLRLNHSLAIAWVVVGSGITLLIACSLLVIGSASTNVPIGRQLNTSSDETTVEASK